MVRHRQQEASGGPRQKKSKIAVTSSGGAALAASGPERNLRWVKIWSEILRLALERAAG